MTDGTEILDRVDQRVILAGPCYPSVNNVQASMDRGLSMRTQTVCAEVDNREAPFVVRTVIDTFFLHEAEARRFYHTFDDANRGYALDRYALTDFQRGDTTRIPLTTAELGARVIHTPTAEVPIPRQPSNLISVPIGAKQITEIRTVREDSAKNFVRDFAFDECAAYGTQIQRDGYVDKYIVIQMAAPFGDDEDDGWNHLPDTRGQQ